MSAVLSHALEAPVSCIVCRHVFVAGSVWLMAFNAWKLACFSASGVRYIYIVKALL